MNDGEMSLNFKDKKQKKSNPIMNFFKGCMSTKQKDQPNEGRRPIAKPKAEKL